MRDTGRAGGDVIARLAIIPGALSPVLKTARRRELRDETLQPPAASGDGRPITNRSSAKR